MGQLEFGRNVIIPTKNNVDWELIRQRKKAQMNKDNTRKKIHRVDHNYKLGDKVMINKNTA